MPSKAVEVVHCKVAEAPWLELTFKFHVSVRSNSKPAFWIRFGGAALTVRTRLDLVLPGGGGDLNRLWTGRDIGNADTHEIQSWRNQSRKIHRRAPAPNGRRDCRADRRGR